MHECRRVWATRRANAPAAVSGKKKTPPRRSAFASLSGCERFLSQEIPEAALFLYKPLQSSPATRCHLGLLKRVVGMRGSSFLRNIRARACVRSPLACTFRLYEKKTQTERCSLFVGLSKAKAQNH